MKLFRPILLFALCVTSASWLHAQSAQPDLVLEGVITGAQNFTNIEVPFDVPQGVHRISVDFSYTGRDQRSVINLGIADPERFRGTSGGTKSHFTLSETDATPSYLPGAMPQGKWKLLLSVPNIRASETSTYRAEIRFNNRVEEQGFTLTPLDKATRWYRGDLHMHTAHSDASCASQSGKSVPCPVFFTAQTAAARGLDFIAITDHNTDSHYNEMRELQPYFDRLLLIPGREMTTFWGHFNIYGITEYADYRATANNSQSINTILQDIRAKGGIASVNHADSPGGEDCMGCAWVPPTPIDYSLFTGIEVINGGRVMLSSADFWDAQLSKGARLAAIGGSDNHNALSEPGKPGSIGWPTSVVEAAELSVAAILDGIRHGRTFIDLTASHDKIIDLEATSPVGKAHMGESLIAAKGTSLQVEVHVSACPRSTVHFFLDGRETPALPPLNATGFDERLRATVSSDGVHHWLRAEVRDGNGSLMLVSSPIYINYVNR
jgi:hypothetical protein